MPRLVLRGIAKQFGPTRALAGVDLEVGRGEVHAVLGENGAGKSTLMKILSGALQADRGSIELDGAPYAPRGPAAARDSGVAMVYQEPWLCPHLSVEENLLLGIEPTAWGLVDRRALRERARQTLGLVTAAERPLRPDRLVSDLSPAEQQLVTVARALGRADCRVLILDEPTSSLDLQDVERLFSVVSELSKRGISILYVSHFLDEVMQVADRYTVLRDGGAVGKGSIADAHPDELIALMAGAPSAARKTADERAGPRGEALLELARLGGRRMPVSASLVLHRGEVLGLGGLMGSGRTELLRAVFGLDPVRSGEIRVGAAWGPGSPVRRLRQGLGLLSEDRAGEGLMLKGSVAANLTLSRVPALNLPRREHDRAQALIARLGIRCRGPEQLVEELSGGNQQKVAFGRLLHHDLDVLLLDEPTRGIDVVSRAEVHGLVRELCRQGKAVLVVSSHWPELLALCDRIAVMRRGVLGVARPVNDWTEESLLREAMGT